MIDSETYYLSLLFTIQIVDDFFKVPSSYETNYDLNKVIETLNSNDTQANNEEGQFSMLEFAMMNFKQSIDK